MIVTFQGDPPYVLPVAQNATARCADETVVMTVYVLDDGKELTPVEIPMTYSVARTLGGLLSSAAIQAELASRKHPKGQQ